jgi:hypothetical protein
VIDSSRLGKIPKLAANARISPQAGQVPGICPSSPAEEVYEDRFEMCFWVPETITGTLTVIEGSAVETFVLPIDYLIEMWADLDATTRAWTTDAKIEVLPYDVSGLPVPVSFLQTGSLNCIDSAACAQTSVTPASGPGNLGSFTDTGIDTSMEAGFSDSGTATDRLDNQLTVSIETEAPWQVAEVGSLSVSFGSVGVQSALDPIRCDSQIKVSGYANGGCVAYYSPATWAVSDQIYPNLGLVAKHMAIASCQLPGHAGALPGCPGYSTPLTWCGMPLVAAAPA